MAPPLVALLVPTLLGFDVLKTDALAARIGEVTTRAGGPVLVAAAGGDAWRALTRLERDTSAKWEIERVPLMGDVDTEMIHVLTSAHSRCAVRVAPGGLAEEWIVSEHGACGASTDAGTEDPGWLSPADSARRARATHSDGSEPGEVPEVTPPAALDPMTLLMLDHTVPNSTTALLSSALVGFGAGHFYAHDNAAGWTYAGIQAGGLVVFGLGKLIAGQAFEDPGIQAGQAIAVGGLSLLIGARLVDTATAPYAAEVDARRQIERQLH